MALYDGKTRKKVLYSIHNIQKKKWQKCILQLQCPEETFRRRLVKMAHSNYNSNKETCKLYALQVVKDFPTRLMTYMLF
jgi:hypothetical protein